MKNQKNHNTNKKRQSTDNKTEMNQILEISDNIINLKKKHLTFSEPLHGSIIE